ncbi:MAG: type 4a pilus biogenesis protein PilO [bacterium]|nr:type 4a pilus biogenesis protein PilO [bacterium]
MFRIILPIIILVTAIAGGFVFVKPLYADISSYKQQIAVYDEALDNSKKLEAERDKLIKKYNSLTTDNLDRLNKLLPESVDNIRLILEIEKIASPYGMELKDVRYDTLNKDKAPDGKANTAGTPNGVADNKIYGSWDLEFATEGKYEDFLKFIADLENNLRIVDITSIKFTSSSVSKEALDEYKYNFKIKTYWLKD